MIIVIRISFLGEKYSWPCCLMLGGGSPELTVEKKLAPPLLNEGGGKDETRGHNHE